MTQKWQILAVLILTVGFAWYYYPEIERNDGGQGVATDLASYYYAGELAADGRDYYDFANVESQQASPDRVYPYIYPPPVADLFAALSALGGLGQLKPMWSLFACLCLAFASVYFLTKFTSIRWAPFAGERGQNLLGNFSICVLIFAVCSLLRLKDNLLLGQVNIFVLVFISIAIVASKRNSFVVSALALAVATMMKITPIFLLPFLAPMRKEDFKKYGIAFFCCALAIVNLSSLFHGYGHWLDFFSASANWGFSSTVEGLFAPSVPFNNSYAGLFSRWLGDGSVAVKCLSWATLFVVFGYLFLAKRKYGIGAVLLPLLIALVVSSPMAYRHHNIFLLPGVLVFVEILLQSKRYTDRKKLSIALALGACLYLSGFPWVLLMGGGWLVDAMLGSLGFAFLVAAFIISSVAGRPERLEGCKP